METDLSKTLSYFLRHAPEEGGLKLDSQGFAPLEQVLETVQSRGWEDLSEEKLREKLTASSVERFEVQGEAVRACYGHSID
ncbi:MAG: RNA 2'-phosphotransferase, partial [bacterium]